MLVKATILGIFIASTPFYLATSEQASPEPQGTHERWPMYVPLFVLAVGIGSVYTIIDYTIFLIRKGQLAQAAG